MLRGAGVAVRKLQAHGDRNMHDKTRWRACAGEVLCDRMAAITLASLVCDEVDASKERSDTQRGVVKKSSYERVNHGDWSTFSEGACQHEYVETRCCKRLELCARTTGREVMQR